MNNETNIGIKFTNKVTNERKVEKYREELSKIYGLLQAMDKGKILAIENATKTTTDALKEQNKMMQTNGSESQKMARNFNLAFNYTTIRTFTRAMRNVVTSMSGMVKQSASYLENMNLLDVAFNNNTREADKFVNKLSEMYGLDESWGYRTVGIFKQLANAMGISAQAGDKLATILTQLSIDTSSLYNIDTSDAVSIFSSALAGQTKPARRLGADITQSTLQQTLDTAGIKEYVANLTYAEKRLVIVASLLQQLTQANNDWGRTIESVANQTRIMNEQWERLTRAVGNVFLPIVKQLLPYLNAILMVFTEIINAIAILVGYNEEDFDYFSGAAESVVDLEDSLEGANLSAKKLNNSLRSFDRLNNISTGKAAGVGITGGTGISPDIMKLFNAEVDKYNSTLSNVQMKAVKIRDSIMDWLGFTKQIDKKTGDVSFKFDHITSGTVLGALVVGGSIFKGVKTIFELLGRFNLGKKTKEASAGFTKLKGSVTGLLVGGTSMLVLNKSMEDMGKNGKSLTNVLGSLAGALGTVGGLAYTGFKIGGTTGAIIGGLVGTLTALITAYQSYGNEMTRTIEKSKQVNQVTQEYMDTMKQANDQIDYNVSIKLGEHQRNEELLNELDKLVDANGNVKKGYEDRAKFIISELKDAYGIELKMIGNNIKGYEKQTEKIRNLIKQQELEILLQGQQEKAMAAKEREDTLLSQYTEQAKAIEELKKQIKANSKDIGELDPFYGGVQVENVHELNNQLEEAKKKLKEYKNAIKNNNAEIIKYEDLKTAQISGNQEKINAALNNTVHTYEKDGELIKTAVAEQLSNLELKYREFGFITQEQYEQQKKETLDFFVYQNNTIKDQTPEMAKAWYDLASQSEENFMSVFKQLDEDIQQDVISNMYQNGYKISEELQRGINAQSPTIKFKADVSNIKTTIENLAKKGFFTPVSSGLYVDENGNLAKHANGGLPPVGQVFVANEKGPELIGQVGGQSFVANQNQIVDFLHEELGNAKSSTPQVMNFYLDAQHKLATYTLDELQGMAKSNGQPIKIGG